MRRETRVDSDTALVFASKPPACLVAALALPARVEVDVRVVVLLSSLDRFNEDTDREGAQVAHLLRKGGPHPLTLGHCLGDAQSRKGERAVAH